MYLFHFPNVSYTQYATRTAIQYITNPSLFLISMKSGIPSYIGNEKQAKKIGRNGLKSIHNHYLIFLYNL